jgi:hypothetical protein
MEAYVPSEGYESRRKKGRTGPKRAVSAYLYFCEHHRSLVKKEHPDMKSSEITARLGQMWNDLKADDKREAELKSFHKKASKDRKRYESEKSGDVKVKEEAHKKEEADKKEEAHKKEEVAVVEEEVAVVEEKAPKKKESSSKKKMFQKFSKEHREKVKKEHPKDTSAERTKRLTKMWKALSKEEQSKYA